MSTIVELQSILLYFEKEITHDNSIINDSYAITTSVHQHYTKNDATRINNIAYEETPSTKNTA